MNEKIITFSKKYSKILVILIFLFLYLFGIVHLKNVGVNYDEIDEKTILKMNDYAIQKIIDSDSDVVQYYESQEIIPIYESVERDHGIAMYYPFIPFLNLDKISNHTLSFAWHFYTFNLYFIGIIFFYFLIKELWKSRKLALLLTLMLFFTPRILGDSLYNNKDGTLLALTIVQMYFGLRFIKNKNFKEGIGFGLASAFACNLKISGFFTFGLIGIFYLMDLTKNKQWTKSHFLVGLVSILICFGVFIVITPAIWAGGFHLIDYFSWSLQNSVRFSRNWGRVYFEHELFEHGTNPLPWYYLPKIMFLTLPIYILILFSVSLILIFKKFKKNVRKEPFLLLSTFLLFFPIVVACVSNPNIYNGWRHFYFLYIPFLIIISYGLHILMESKYKKSLFLSILLFVFTNIIGIVKNDSYSSVYYNVLAINAGENYEMDYYGVTATKALKELSDRVSDTLYVYGFRAWALELNYMFMERVYQDKIVIIKDEEELNALIENGIRPYYFHSETYDHKTREKVKDKEKVYDIKAFGNIIASIYK